MSLTHSFRVRATTSMVEWGQADQGRLWCLGGGTQKEYSLTSLVQ